MTRRSISRNATSSATAPASTAIVRVSPQPYCGAWEIAATSSTSPPVPASAPAASNLRRTVSSRLSGTIRGANSSATAPIGTLR